MVKKSDNSNNNNKNKKGKMPKSRSKNKSKNYKKNQSSDEEDFVEYDENEKIDKKEFKKMLGQLYPSKYMKEKIEDDEDSGDNKKKKKSCKKKKRKKNAKTDEDEEIDEREKRRISRQQKKESLDEEKEEKKSKKKRKKKNNKNLKREEDDEDEDSEWVDEEGDGEWVDEEEEDEEDEDEDEDEEDEALYYEEDEMYENEEMMKNGKFNIIFTIGGPNGGYDENYDDYYDEYLDEDEEDEDEDEEDEDEEEELYEEDDGEENVKKKKKRKKKSLTKEEIEKEELDGKKTEETFKKLRETYDEMLKEDKDNKVAQKLKKELEKEEKKFKKEKTTRENKVRVKNTKKFKKLLHDKNMNDNVFFKNKLTLCEQEKIIKELDEMKKHSTVEIPYRVQLLQCDIPVKYKSLAMRKINNLRHMDPGSGEYYKIKNWVDTFMRIPFGKRSSLPVNIENGVDSCHEFMENAKNVLDECVYGLDNAKMQILQMVGQWIANPDAVGTAIAIKGPMGTGKTTLVKNGISKILNREFAFIALGGATDSSHLEGHSYTYEGSTWGKIVDILIQCKTMNPVIYFDELDKISNTPKGEEIVGILTHLTDTTQNSQFHDKYFSEIDFDLSKCLFIFSYNHEEKVNPILKDRMYRIETKGYDKKEKTIIANNYMLPKICEQVNFKKDDIIIPEETIHYIVKELSDNEKGVRNLKRCLEIIYTKLNLYRLMKPETNLFKKEMSLKVEFPYTVTPEIVKKLIIKEDNNKIPFGMYL